MANFTLPSFDSVDLGSGVFYSHIVNIIPVGTETTVADLTLSDAVGYVPQYLSGLTYTDEVWTFDEFNYPRFTFTTPPVGIVVCKRIGSEIASTDPVLFFTDFQNSLGQSVTYTTGRYAIVINFPPTGMLRFKQLYEYTSGSWLSANTEAFPKGSFWLLGTRNNTQSFISPSINSVIFNLRSNTSTDLTNRSLIGSTTLGQNGHAMAFGSRKVKLGTIAFRVNNSGSTWGFTIFGSNTTPDITDTSISNNLYWTQIGSGNTSGANGWAVFDINSTEYFSNFKIQYTGSAGLYSTITEIELFNTKMASTDLNLKSNIIDSPLYKDILDYSGYNNTFNPTGNVINSASSLYLDGSSYLSLNLNNYTNYSSVTPNLFNFGSRDFKIEFEIKYAGSTVNNNVKYNILNLNQTDDPLYFAVKNNTYVSRLSSGAVEFYNSTNNLSSPNLTSYDKVSISNTAGTITTTVNNSAYSSVASILDSNTGQLTLGYSTTDSTYGRFYIRNLKVST